MKENKWWKEIPLIVVMVCPFLVYLYLKPLLPGLIPSHYTMDATRWGYIGGIGLLVLINLVIYRVYAVAYRNKEGKPLRRTSYAIIRVSPLCFGPRCLLLYPL